MPLSAIQIDKWHVVALTVPNLRTKHLSLSFTSYWEAGSSSALFASGSPETGPRSVCRKSAAFLFLSACNCFSFDSLEAWASFSRAAAASRSSSFCLAKGNEISGQHRREVVRGTKTKQKKKIVLANAFHLLHDPCMLCTGQSGFIHQRSHQGQSAECDTVLFWLGAAADIRADGKGLLPPLSALRTLLGLNQPKKTQLHLNFLNIIKDTWMGENNMQGKKETKGKKSE